MKKYFRTTFLFLIAAMVLIPSIIVSAKAAMKIDKKTYIYTGTRKEAKFHTNKGYAYCITPHRTGASQGTTLTFKNRYNSGGVLYLLEKAGTSDSEYLATQLAIWKYDSNYLPSFYINHSGYEVVKKAKALANEAAKHKNYKGNQPTVSIVLSSTKLTIDNNRKTYRTGIIKASIAYASNAKLSLKGAPTGTKIIDKNGNVISKVKNNGTFYITIPAENVKENITFTLNAEVKGKVPVVERYTVGNSKWQDLIVLTRVDKTVSTSKKLSVTPIKRTCEIFNGKYYDRNGNVTDKTTYSIQCEKHTCEKVGNKYFGRDGKETDKTTYSIQCEKHTCEVVGNKYFGSDGKETDKTTYSIQCEKHSCEKIGDKIFGKNGNIVTEEEYDLECNKHTCEKIGNKYFGKESYEVDEVTYQKECFTNTCKKVGNTYFGSDGSEVSYADFTIQCEKHTCEFINGRYFGQSGFEVTEDEFINQCVHTCEVYNNQYYGTSGKVVSQEEYKAQCEAVVVQVPDTASNPWDNLFSIIIGSSLLGTVGGILSYAKNKKHA